MTYCGRKGCENPAIDRRSNRYGYICPSCVRELEQVLIRDYQRTGGYAPDIISKFMATFNSGYQENLTEAREVIDIEFPVDLDN